MGQLVFNQHASHSGHLLLPAGECPCGCRRYQLQPFAFQPTCRTSGSSFQSPTVQRIDPGSTFRRITRSGHNPTTYSKAWRPSGPSTVAGANWNLDSWVSCKESSSGSRIAKIDLL